MNNTISKIAAYTGKHTIAQYLLLLLVVSLGYYPLTFLIHGIGHDFLNCWVPWRYYISSSIAQDYFPWWNPYQQMGYPIHADLQGPLWYPENMLSALLGIQSISYLLIVHVVHVWIGTVAMLELGRFFKASLRASMLVAIIYGFSGFHLAHSMHQFSIYSAAWIPFLLLFWLKMLETGKTKYVFYGAFIMFLNLTGGNHTFTIIAIYLFAALWITYAVKHYKDKQKHKRLLLNTSLYAVLCLLTGMLTLTLFYQVTPYVARMNGLAYDAASVNPFTITSMLSFVNPASTINAREVFNTDPTMSNAWFTIFAFAVFIYSLFRQKEWFEKVLLVFSICCLFISFGDATPVYKLCFNGMPFIDKFRFPSYFTYFIILLALPVVARTITGLEKSGTNTLKWIFAVVLLVSLSEVIYGLMNIAAVSEFLAKPTNGLFDFSANTNFATNLLIFGTFGCLVTLVYMLFIKKKWISYLVLLELFMFCPFLMHYTTVVDYKPAEVQANINNYQQPFNTLTLDPINKHSRDLDHVPGLWANINVYLKNIDQGGFNSFRFSQLQMLQDSLTGYSGELFKNPVVYISDKPVSKADVARLNSFDSGMVVLNEKDYRALSTKIIPNGHQHHKVSVLKINPEQFQFRAFTGNDAVLSLLQSNYTGWKVCVDGKPATLLETNFMFMGVVLPKGDHLVEFNYENKPVVITATISYAAWLILLGIIIFIRYTERKQAKKKEQQVSR